MNRFFFFLSEETEEEISNFEILLISFQRNSIELILMHIRQKKKKKKKIATPIAQFPVVQFLRGEKKRKREKPTCKFDDVTYLPSHEEASGNAGPRGEGRGGVQGLEDYHSMDDPSGPWAVVKSRGTQQHARSTHPLIIYACTRVACTPFTPPRRGERLARNLCNRSVTPKVCSTTLLPYLAYYL